MSLWTNRTRKYNLFNYFCFSFIVNKRMNVKLILFVISYSSGNSSVMLTVIRRSRLRYGTVLYSAQDYCHVTELDL